MLPNMFVPIPKYTKLEKAFKAFADKDCKFLRFLRPLDWEARPVHRVA